MKPENTKPSLESLLQSKKLDQPSEIFWNDFQDQVKGRALASLSQKTLPQRCTRYMCVALPVVIIALIGVNLSSYLTKPDDFVENEAQTIAITTPSESNLENLAFIEELESQEIVGSSSDESFISLSSSDRESYVDHSFHLEKDDAYEVQYLSNLEYHRDDLLARHTF